MPAKPVNEVPTVGRKVEEGLLYHLKLEAMKRCKATAGAYAECCRGRTLSTVWACRQELSSLNECLHGHTNPNKLNELKRRWSEAGRPEAPDWDSLLVGL